MKEKNNNNSKAKAVYQSGSGSEYHEEHAGNVTGYGEIDPNAEGLTNMKDKNSSSS
ncbi:hypothetical protein [Neobacillus mesonae]|uniref:hypothetical protein n=1 Tax=Neobacillus mesonae TaxID=1193713 RepID=UPI000AE3EB38|nr:hypothetical protein [Neobacillus mesonae]